MNVPGDNARAVSVTIIVVVVVVVSPASADAANPRGLVDSADASGGGVDRRRRIREDVFPARAGVQFAIITQRSLQLSVVPTHAHVVYVTLRRHARDDDEDERGYEDES